MEIESLQLRQCFVVRERSALLLNVTSTYCPVLMVSGDNALKTNIEIAASQHGRVQM
jgi:hypothetical protein